MKFKIILLTLALAVAAFAGENVREHRGFYYNYSVGFSYASLDFYSEEDDSWGSYDDAKEVRDYSYSGFSFLTMNFRFGRAFGNAVALFFSMHLNGYSGHLEGLSSDYGGILEAYDDDNMMMLNGAVGVGFSIYPFRNPDSPMNGFFIGCTHLTSFTTFSDNTPDVVTGSFLEQIEIGKDWWISENWSLGFGISYYVPVGNIDLQDNLVNLDQNKFQITFRLTRG